MVEPYSVNARVRMCAHVCIDTMRRCDDKNIVEVILCDVLVPVQEKHMCVDA